MNQGEASDRLGPGARIGGRYRLQEILGRGGMAVVWKALDERLQRPVAVKVISDALAGDETFLRRFGREAKIAAGLTHPNLVRVFDYGASAPRPYLVMEHVAGRTLAERIADHSVRELDIESLARQLLGGLAAIHAAGVVHRDVKPANVLLAADGRPRLTDFGIAQPPEATRLTATGEVIGTLPYMAPEVAAGEAATERSDLYSLGVVLRECSPAAAAGLAVLVERLTADDPEARPATARGALRLLDAEPAPTARPLPAGAVPASSPKRKIRVDGRWLLAGLGAAAAAALAALALASGGGGGGETVPAQGSDKPEAQQEGIQDPGGGAGGADAPQPPPAGAEEPPAPPAELSCAALEAARSQLEEGRRAAEELAGEDKEARKAAKEAFKARKKEIDERRKQCAHPGGGAPGKGDRGGDRDDGDGDGDGDDD